MPELKVICNCGQKYKFDVEPVNGRMPFAVTCPVCGIDGTHHANAMLNQLSPPSLAAMPAIGSASAATMAPATPTASVAMPAPAAAGPGGMKLSINRPAAPPPGPPPLPGAVLAPPVPPPAHRPGRPSPVTASVAVPKYMQDNAAIQNNSFLLGTLGAILGAVVAVGFMVGTKIFLGFSFPMFGTIMGAIIGFGARLGYRGTDSTLGGMSALVAFLVVGGTLYLMFGIPGLVFSLMSIVIGTMAAFKIASG